MKIKKRYKEKPCPTCGKLVSESGAPWSSHQRSHTGDHPATLKLKNRKHAPDCLHCIGGLRKGIPNGYSPAQRAGHLRWYASRGTPEERFLSRVDKTPGYGPNNDCWVQRNFYRPEIILKHPNYQLSLEIKLGRKLLPGMYACHKCDNRMCCNPEHLFEGTQKDNMQDAKAKGRLPGPSPEGIERIIKSKQTPEFRAKMREVVTAIWAERKRNVSAL